MSTIHGLIEAQVRRTPDVVALEFEGAELTYRELDRRANRLAHALRRSGAGPETVVAVGAQRSLDLLVTLLGVLKSGAAYLPLDLELPTDRLTYMADQGGAVALVRGPGMHVDLGLPGLPELTLADTDGDPDEPVDVAVDGRNACYVMYTSGSTGRPKGVVVEHRGVVNRLRWGQHEYGMTSDERVLQKTPYAFDVSVHELFWPLMVGARLVIARPGGHRDTRYLVETIQRREITSVHFIPTMLALFVGEPGVADCHSLRRILASGEALPTDLQNRVLRALPDVELHNLYGPTEASIEVSAWACRPEWSGASVPIGAAVDNTQLHILDAELRPADGDGPGELYLAGVQLARGYLGQPGLTAERFLPDPYGEPGGRMYRSGDLAGWHRPGVVEYLGRVDEQVKLAGNRVELGEIQAVLDDQPGVRASVVVATGDAAEKRLVAYVVGDHPDLAGLRDRLTERLPGYMVPSTFVPLAELPLTPSGKLDRKALPAPDRPDLAVAYRAPENPAQERVAKVWTDVFGVARVGVDDTFFALGGHSLLAVRLIARMREEFGVEVSIRDLFEGTTVAGLAEAVTATPAGDAPALVAGGDDAPAVASFGQERLLFLERIHPDSPNYVIPVAWRIDGHLDEETLRRALRRLAARHDALRTRFAGDTPVVEPEPAVALERVDADAWHEELAAERIRRPFDLVTGPLWRATLVRLPEHDVLLLVLHHVVADGWSLGVIARELGELYAGVAPPAPAVRYVDFARWQRADLDPARLAAQLDGWRDALAGVPALELPTDRPRPAVLGADGATHRFALPADALRRLAAFAQDQQTTLHTVLLAAFQALLGRWSGQRDFAVGTPVAGRSRAEVENVVGFFVNTVAVRADLGGDPTVTELVGRVREATLRAYQHQDVPFEQVVAELRPERDLSRTPIYQTMFALRDTVATTLRLPGRVVTELALGWRTAKFDLTLFVDEAPDGTRTGLFEYATDLFDPATVGRLADAYVRLLGALADDAGARFGDWPVLDSAQRDALLAAGTAATPDLPARALHHLVADRVAAGPDRPAVVDGATVWTYAELDRRANRLAHHLIDLGVGPETVVAVSLPRGAELVRAQLAVLRAGGAYLPLDADQPTDRSRHMVAGAGATLLVTAAGHHDGAGLGCHVVDLVRDAAELDRRPATDPAVAVDPEQLAYVVHTSGSTGRPKGIGITHRNLVRTVHQGGYLDLAPDDRVAFAANPLFDAAAFEVWATLAAGATVVVTPPDVALSTAALADHLARHRVTTLFLTTALFHQVARERPDALRGLRHVLFGGETSDPATVDALLAHGGPDRLLHMYGPAESTTFSTWHPVTAPTGDACRVPIGRPTHHTTAYVVDRLLRPVPHGVVGELLLGGAGLARGYTAPAMTAERFLPDPFGAPGGRVYRTGDLVRWAGDGVLEFVGRADGQVKVRGFRVEPGEVETAARRHPAVRDAVVLARPDHTGVLNLVAYVAGDPAELGDLRAWLGRELPAYLVPAAVVVLDELPLTGNGKVDRAALPEPTYAAGTGRREPATALERQLVDIFREVLGVTDAGMDDDFFALGGHSLLAIKVVGAVAARTGREITFRDLFTARSVAGLARLLAESDTLVAPITRGDGTTGLPVSFGQERMVFLDRLEGAGAAYTVPLAWRLTGPVHADRLAAALDALVERHESLRTRFSLADGVVRQDVTPGWAGLDRRVVASVADAEADLAREAIRPFELTTGPLFRAVLWQAGDTHLLLLAMHHAVSDGWSAAVLIRELEAGYDGADVPRPPVRYADFAAWQRHRLAGDRLAGDLDHWRRRLADLPDLELPTDRPRPSARDGAGASVGFTVEPELVAALERLGRAHGATVFMTLLATYQVLLGRWSGQTDFAVGTPVAGRDRPEVRDVIGFFLNTLVLRADLSGGPRFADLLDRVRDDALAAYEHQELPFGRLVEELSPERDLGRSPLFQALFSYNDWTLDTLRLGSAEGVAQPVDRGAAKLDLTLELVHGPDGLAGSFDYTTDIFDAATIARMAQAYVRLLRAVAAEPAARIADLPLAATEAAPAAARPAAPFRSLLDRIAEHVRATPDATALTGPGGELTYADLDRRSNRLAHHLRSRGIGPEDRVGLRLPRGVDTVVAVLAVWKAGGAFVGLDPELPPQRLARLAEGAGVRLVLDPDDVAEPASAAHPATRPDVDTRPDQLAYLVHTSGSTGAPKGVLVEHGGITAYLDTIGAHYRLDADDVVLQRASPSFDAFLRDAVGPLTVGATVLVAERSDLSTLAADLPGRPAPTVLLSMVPSLLHQLLDAGDVGAATLPALRLLVLSGEPCTPALLARVHDALPGLRRVVNQYGPTEATVTTTVADLDPSRPYLSVGIGVAMPGTTVHVLDAALRPVPVGVFGEVHIGGTGVSRGYHDRPGLTAAAYLPDPAGPPGARMYRTGDAARRLADGTLEFRGRLDRQVKVRGVRVEPAEVEAALAEHPDVGAAAVVARPDGPNGWRLAGYAQRTPAGRVDEADLRRHLETRLPSAMIPAELLVLDALPLLGNGKVDRAALPEIRAELPAVTRVAPRTDVERVVAEIWADLLHRPDIGIEDDFFALGGHSLTALRVISRLRERLATPVTLRVFFEARTIARLARKLEETR
ncbi:amino acid adenylation domain-containing protein [Micromonospora sp. WMMC241]|uniref:non-ribosomal peptide synthetase n=1 Tax=Micromonospora sp. WMMC241 TaxID=3015159 RepID=UPI0022B63BC9|nr:non-ribosomal peptide synthetase [Micromonospora sp. WMMC241]MCZ7436790.1 amino acid adenylation domain-containing protein [Micromonospora sp. WMMC241]